SRHRYEERPMSTDSSSRRPARAGRPWLAAGLAGLLLAHTAAQAPPPPPRPASPTFEVATVKQNKSGEGFIRFGLQPGGRVSATNVPLKELIRMAYNLQPFQIEGGPGWINSDRFDVPAKAEGDVSRMAPGQTGPI